jgi:hypothetical protein
MEITIGIHDDGTFFLKDSNGNVLPETIIGMVKKNYAPHLRNLMEQMCRRINNEVEQLENLYLDTPPPWNRTRQEEQPFSEPAPLPPVKKRLGIFEYLWKPKRIKRDQEFSEAQIQYSKEYGEWEKRKQNHLEREVQKVKFYKGGGTVVINLFANFK